MAKAKAKPLNLDSTERREDWIKHVEDEDGATAQERDLDAHERADKELAKHGDRFRTGDLEAGLI